MYLSFSNRAKLKHHVQFCWGASPKPPWETLLTVPFFRFLTRGSVKVGYVPRFTIFSSLAKDSSQFTEKVVNLGGTWTEGRAGAVEGGCSGALEFPPCEELQPVESELERNPEQQRGPVGTERQRHSVSPIPISPSAAYNPHPTPPHARSHTDTHPSFPLSSHWSRCQPIGRLWRLWCHSAVGFGESQWGHVTEPKKRESLLGWFKPGQGETDRRWDERGPGDVGWRWRQTDRHPEWRTVPWGHWDGSTKNVGYIPGEKQIAVN